MSLFQSTNGLKQWKNITGWRDLVKAKRSQAMYPLDSPVAGRLLSSASAATPMTMTMTATTTTKYIDEKTQIPPLFGAKFDEHTGEVTKLLLPANGLKGNCGLG